MCVVTRHAAVLVLSAVTRAAMTRTIRGIRSEVDVDFAGGPPEVSVMTCDTIVTVPIAMLSSSRGGQLSLDQRAELARSIRDALDVHY